MSAKTGQLCSFRSTLVQLGEARCCTAEAFKAWSQNLDHEGVLTTLCSYGRVAPRRQGEIIKDMAKLQPESMSSADDVAEAVLRAGREGGLIVEPR